MHKKLQYLLLFIIIVSPLKASLINTYNPTVNDRFSAGWPAAPVPNIDPTYAGLNYDLSGVGWNGTRNVALLDNQHFLFANHFGTAGSYDFYSPSLGSVVTYFVSALPAIFVHPTTGEQSDLRVGQIFQDAGLSIPGLNPAHGITSYAIPYAPRINDFQNKNMIAYGHDNGSGAGPRVAPEKIDFLGNLDINGNSIDDNVYLAYDYGASASEAYLQPGDSGGPDFLVYDDKISLVGMHLAITTPPEDLYSVDVFVPAYINQLEKAGVNLEFVFVPEPSKSFLFIVFFLFTLLQRRFLRISFS